MTLTTFFSDYYKPLRLRRGCSPNTSRLYAVTIGNFGMWLGHDPTLKDIADEVKLARYLSERAETLSAYTVEKERSQLMALARFALERGMLPGARLPSCPPGVIPERTPTSWSIDDMRRLHEVAVQRKGWVGPIPAGVFFPALLDVLWETGERIGAIMDANRADFDPPYLNVRAEARKGRRRDRVYQLSPLTSDRLRMCEVGGEEKLFYWPHAYNHLYFHLKSMLKKAGLQPKKRQRFHQIRRTAASHLAAAGGDPVKFLDHASPSTTKRWYLDPRVVERGPKPHEILPRLDQAK
jgi:integrase